MKSIAQKSITTGLLILLTVAVAPGLGITSVDTTYYLVELVNPYNSASRELKTYGSYYYENPHSSGSGVKYTFHEDIRPFIVRVESSCGTDHYIFAYFTDGVTVGERQQVANVTHHWPTFSTTYVKAPPGTYVYRIEVVGYGTDPTANVKSRIVNFQLLLNWTDYDSDGLSNLAEFENRTSYFDPDTDGDGVLDGLDDDPLKQKMWFTLHIVPTLGGAETRPSAINDVGQITGYSKLENGQLRAFIYDGSAMLDIGTLGGSLSWGRDINDQGDVVGYSYTANYATHAFLYKADEQSMTDIDSAASSYGGNTTGVAVNNNRQVALLASKKVFVGWDRVLGIKKYKYYDYALLYENGTATLLNPAGNTKVVPKCINERGVVGCSSSSTMYLYDPAVPSMTMYDNLLWADDINDNDEVTGWYYGHVFVYDLNDSVMEDIGSLGSTIYATKMNNSAQVVGHCKAVAYNYQDHAFLYDPATGIMNLNDHIHPNSLSTLNDASLTFASDINNPGQIVGNLSDGRAFRLDPVAWTK